MADAELPQIAKITNDDLPAAYQFADHAAGVSRRNHLWLVWADLVLILAGGIVTSWAIESQIGRVALAMADAVALGLGSLLFLTVRASNLGKTWFGAVRSLNRSRHWLGAIRSELILII